MFSQFMVVGVVGTIVVDVVGTGVGGDGVGDSVKQHVVLHSAVKSAHCPASRCNSH
jgi:hypothetical protein